eukprot:359047-Chlamydomonas_euryale.AAC.9
MCACHPHGQKAGGILHPTAQMCAASPAWAEGRWHSPPDSSDVRCVTRMGRRPGGMLNPTAQMCAAAGALQLMHLLDVTRLTRLGHVVRMPDVCCEAGFEEYN